jgi:hypothetical protein
MSSMLVAFEKLDQEGFQVLVLVVPSGSKSPRGKEGKYFLGRPR